MAKPKIENDGRTITVRVPIAIRKRGGRKVVLAPGAATGTAPLLCQQPDNAMIKAIARAFRWRDMLENGSYATITELGQAEGIGHGYVGRILRLTLLTPDVVEAIVNGCQSPEVTLATLMQPLPVRWPEQRTKILAH